MSPEVTTVKLDAISVWSVLLGVVLLGSAEVFGDADRSEVGEVEFIEFSDLGPEPAQALNMKIAIKHRVIHCLERIFITPQFT